MKFKVGDKVRIRPDLNYIHSSYNLVVVEDMIASRGEVDTIAVVTLDFNGRAEYRLEGHRWIWNDNMLIPASKPVKVMDRVAQRFKVGDKVRLKSGLIDRQMYGSLPYDDSFPQEEYTVKLCDSRDNTYLCTIPDKCDFWLSEEMLEPVYADGGFCTGFKGGNIPTSVKNRTKDVKDWVDSLTDAWARLGCTTFRVPPSEVDELIKKEFNVKWFEEEDRPMTYYVTDDKRIDKTCNKQIDTKTTHVAILGGRYTGKATCDAENYDQRQGLLEAIANAVCGGNFDKHYNDDIKARKRLEKALCRCSICGVTYDTPTEARACEQAHKDRKQAKLEKYLISKEAKRRIAEAEREDKIEELMKDILKKKVEK